jgi:hypothetical protein
MSQHNSSETVSCFFESSYRHRADGGWDGKLEEPEKSCSSSPCLQNLSKRADINYRINHMNHPRSQNPHGFRFQISLDDNSSHILHDSHYSSHIYRDHSWLIQLRVISLSRFCPDISRLAHLIALYSVSLFDND